MRPLAAAYKFDKKLLFVRCDDVSFVHALPYINAGRKRFQNILIENIEFARWAENSQISYDTNTSLCLEYVCHILIYEYFSNEP